jgi:hypothetical protein
MPVERYSKIVIDGKLVSFDSNIALRWVNGKDGSKATPTLYRNGKRVTKQWHIQLDHYQEADPDGGNANTD